MNTQESINYQRVAEAIGFIKQNAKQQPDLEEIASKVHLSPFHFQKLFMDWAGVSPKKFLQYLNVEYAKQMLKEKQATLFDVAHETGLSGTGRLHDLFMKIEGMTPGEFKNGGKQLNIRYSFAKSPFGNIIIASTSKGICQLAFTDNEEKAFSELKNLFPNATYTKELDTLQGNALQIFEMDWENLDQIKFHIKGTPFQIKVWEALLKIPMGHLSTYSNIATKIGQPTASRAVGSAIGDNPIAFLIPCHRVIKSTGIVGDYHWGTIRKTALIGWEIAKSDNENQGLNSKS